MLVRITVMVLRISALLALLLGILFWADNAYDLLAVHIGVGVLVSLSLWVLGGTEVLTKDGNWGLAAGAFVLGLILPILGMTQQRLLPGSMHRVVEVIHLLLGLAAIGLGEIIAGRYRRLMALATT